VLSAAGKAFYLVESADGHAFDAWHNLLELYEGSDTMDLLTLLKDFASCMMEDEDGEPTFWFMQIDHLATKIKKAGGNAKSESEKIAHVIMNAPDRDCRNDARNAIQRKDYFYRNDRDD
jgi:hypothetical protein